MRRSSAVNPIVFSLQGGEITRRLDFITILLHFRFPLYFTFKTEYTNTVKIFPERWCPYG